MRSGCSWRCSYGASVPLYGHEPRPVRVQGGGVRPVALRAVGQAARAAIFDAMPWRISGRVAVRPW